MDKKYKKCRREHWERQGIGDLQEVVVGERHARVEEACEVGQRT